MPRKNAKTALSAFLLLLHLCGPEAVQNSQLYSAAQSKDQAATIFKLAAKVVRYSPLLSEYVVIRDTVKELACPEIGTLYAALSADKSTAHGKSPIFAVHDELGQVKGPVSELYEAVETGMGAHDAPLSIVISTQAPTDNDLLSRLIDDARDGSDPHTVLIVFEAPEDADPFAVETMQACNPAWGDFLNDAEVIRNAEAARRLPSQEAGFRNLHLNQRVETQAAFVTQGVWAENGGDPGLITGPVWAGLDLSEVADLTAFVAVSQEPNDTWGVHPTFWLPGDGLLDKARADRVPYDVWRDRGHLLAAPGRTVDYAYVADWLAGFCDRHDVRRIAFDRWNMRHLRPWLEKAGFREDQLEGDGALFVGMGQGFQSMSPALRDLESELLQSRLRHGAHPVLEMCARNAVVQSDPTGNRKLTKAKSRGRIDGMVALAMAMAAAVEDRDDGEGGMDDYFAALAI